MTIPILVCDDLPEARSNLIAMLRRYESAHDAALEIETAADGTELLRKWCPGRWALIFLDIYMPEMDGIEAARRLRRVDADCELIFATTSREHGMEGFELRAMDYLTKPFSQRDVECAMDWFLSQHPELRAPERQHELSIRSQWDEQTIPVEEIRYIESRGHRCVIPTGGREASVRKSMDDMLAMLGSDSFFRCHQSFLINFAHVRSVGKQAFVMDGGDSVPISAANRVASRTALSDWAALHGHALLRQ